MVGFISDVLAMYEDMWTTFVARGSSVARGLSVARGSSVAHGSSVAKGIMLHI